MKMDFTNLARSMDICGDTIVRKVGLSTFESECFHKGAEAIEKLQEDNRRLRGALEDIAKAYPCGDIYHMRRLAADATGLDIKIERESP